MEERGRRIAASDLTTRRARLVRADGLRAITFGSRVAGFEIAGGFDLRLARNDGTNSRSFTAHGLRARDDFDKLLMTDVREATRVTWSKVSLTRLNIAIDSNFGRCH